MSKNKVSSFKKKYFKNKFKVLILATILFMHFAACKGQINSKEKEQIQSNEAVKIGAEHIVYNQYKDGKKNGLWKMYFQNGQLESESNYKNDKKEGLCKEWWENGKLASEGMYVNGKANGLMKWYSEKGHLGAIGNMIDDKRNGEWKICDWQDETFCTIGHFIDEVEHGPWRSYHENGQLERENLWKKGKLISSKCWDENGIEIACD